MIPALRFRFKDAVIHHYRIEIDGEPLVYRPGNISDGEWSIICQRLTGKPYLVTIPTPLPDNFDNLADAKYVRQFDSFKEGENGSKSTNKRRSRRKRGL